MQVIQIMHGIQISPMTVKVSWAKLFPEDTHDDGGEAADDGQQPQDSAEVFPLKMALTKPKNIKSFTTQLTSSLPLSPSLHSRSKSAGRLGESSHAGAVARSGYLADGAEGGSPLRDEKGTLPLLPLLLLAIPLTPSSSLLLGPSVSFLDTTASVGSASVSASASATSSAAAADPVAGMTAEVLSQSINSEDEVYIKTTAKDFFMLDFFEEQAHQDALVRTSLKAPLERPGPKFFIKRQNNIEVSEDWLLLLLLLLEAIHSHSLSLSRNSPSMPTRCRRRSSSRSMRGPRRS